MANRSSSLPARPLRIAALVSGNGTNLQALLDDQDGYEIVAVIADRPDAYGLQRGLQANVPSLCLPLRQPKNLAVRTEWENLIVTLIKPFAPDWLIMAGWMRIMSPAFITHFPGRIINQHPALLPPDNAPTVTLQDGSTIPAIRGAHAVRDALRFGLPATGCTIHEVTELVDVGPILAQREIAILPGDTEASLHERIKQAEREMIVAVVRQLIQTAQ